MTVKFRNATLFLMAYLSIFLGVLAWGFSLSGAPRERTLKESNPALFAKSEWTSTLKQEMKGNH
jgi:hypothetical protein